MRTCVVLLLILLTIRSAFALKGKADCVRLVFTAIGAYVAAAPMIFQYALPDDIKFELRSYVRKSGNESWVAWYANNAIHVAVTSALVTAGMMYKYCTKIY